MSQLMFSIICFSYFTDILYTSKWITCAFSCEIGARCDCFRNESHLIEDVFAQSIGVCYMRTVLNDACVLVERSGDCIFAMER